MPTGFRVKKAVGGVSVDQMRAFVPMGNSLTITDGDALVMSAGKLALAGSGTTLIDFIACETYTSGATEYKEPLLLPFAGNDLVCEIKITPLFNNVACAANGSTTTAVIAQAGYSGSELVGGTIYIAKTRQQRVITASSATSGGNVTVTWIEPINVATASGDLVSIVPFGVKGDPKLASQSTVDTSLANKTGGPFYVTKIDLRNQKIEVRTK